MIRIGSRGSPLALWQAKHVAQALHAAGHATAIEIIRTTGDRLQNVPFAEVGTKGMFTKEIEQALAAGRIELAVHSLKDLPTVLDPLFTLAAIPLRADPSDALVSRDCESFAALPPGSRVGTSSLRRQSQLRAYRSDLEYVGLRGNVDTRLRKLAGGEVEAIVLASAGLDRLGYTQWVRERFATLILCPAAGQGALAIETRAGDEATARALAPLDDAETRFAVTAERAALHALGGGCQVPIGLHCARDAGGWMLSGVVASAAGEGLVRVQIGHQHAEGELGPERWHGSVSPAGAEHAARELGERLARQLLAQGAGALLGPTDAAIERGPVVAGA
ncbi:MAG TPA: hydroxymethylbilane synthase [Acidobacteriaceae bacterium]